MPKRCQRGPSLIASSHLRLLYRYRCMC
ncbi:putative importin-5 [Iris pallida]|uniref:Importin-5 n=1 Tax=Iris pallida TaxID=29817 RepID=A0AAX6H5V1_IRIPA|nr:putative importin-5 [Iris pallida]